MRERAIRLYDYEVRAVLAGRQTQLRRVVRPQPRDVVPEGGLGITKKWVWDKDGSELRPGHPLEWLLHNKCPHGIAGDQLWVKEEWAPMSDLDPHANEGMLYRASVPAGIHPAEDSTGAKWRSPARMHRRDSRITLEILTVRVERLQEISEADALAEGCPECPQCLGSPWGRGALDDELSNAAGGRPWSACFGRCDGLTAKQWFRTLWQSISGPGSWDANPWVWVTEFRRVHDE